MASPRTYECFVCKRQGLDGVQVYLDGKDAEGHTKYLNEDMSAHTHQGTGTAGQKPMMTKQPSKDEILPLLRIMSAKLDRLLAESSNSDNHSEQEERDGLLTD